MILIGGNGGDDTDRARAAVAIVSGGSGAEVSSGHLERRIPEPSTIPAMRDPFGEGLTLRRQKLSRVRCGEQRFGLGVRPFG